MARDAVTVTEMSRDTAVEEETGVTISATNGAAVAVGHTQDLILSIRNTTAAEKDLTIKAGYGLQSALGDLVIPLAAETSYLIAVEGSRFVQEDGSLYLDFEASMTGTVCAYRTPRGL